MTMKSITSSLLITLFLLIPAQVLAAKDPIYTSFWSNLAVGGYDPVAYFTENKPVEGKSRFSHQYKGAEWRFSSQKNLDLFVAEPEKYAPQYGGYCAWLIAKNDTAKGDPKNWTILDGKLYLNYDDNIQSKWLKDPHGFVSKADKNWPTVLN